MKTLLGLTLLVSLLFGDLLAEQTSSDAPDRRTFFQRFFNKAEGAQPPNSNEVFRESWQLFPAGELPRGKHVNDVDAENLAPGDYSGEMLFLSGRFVVTARGEHRAILRSTRKKPSMRVIVEYPPSLLPPAEGEQLTRDESRAFLIRKVRRARHDNSLLVDVREITLP